MHTARANVEEDDDFDIPESHVAVAKTLFEEGRLEFIKNWIKEDGYVSSSLFQYLHYLLEIFEHEMSNTREFVTKTF